MMLLLLTSLAWGTPEAVHVVEHYTKEYQAQCIDTIVNVATGLKERTIRMQPTYKEDANKIHFKMIDKRGEQFECTVTINSFVDGTYCNSQQWGYRSDCLLGLEWIPPVGGMLVWEGGSTVILHYKISAYSAPDLAEAIYTIGSATHPAAQALAAPFEINETYLELQ